MSDTEREEEIFRNYLSTEITNNGSLMDYIINMNMKQLINTGRILDNSEYYTIVTKILQEYGATSLNQSQDDITNDNIITLQNKSALIIQNSNVEQYEYVENGQSILVERSAKNIYYKVLEHLSKQNYDIYSKKYIPIATEEQWHNILGTSQDIHIETKYTEFMGKMLFISITPANIIRKLTRLFMDLSIDLNNFKIYLKSNINNTIEHQKETQLMNTFTFNNTDKVGTVAKTGFTWLLTHNKLRDSEIQQLQDPTFSKRTFDINYPALVSADKETNRFVNEYPRYYAHAIAGQFICNDWFDRNMSQLKKYLRKFEKSITPNEEQ